MKTIGFTEVYYTLWEVGEPYDVPHFYNGMQVGNTVKQEVSYCQNLAQDLDKAKSHPKLEGQKYNIDLELRGHSSFTRTLSSDIKNREEYYPKDCFSFGRMEGVRFIDATDIWQLKRAYNEEQSGRRKAAARRRLIDLGEFVRYPHQHSIGSPDLNWGKRDENGNLLPENRVEQFVLRNYTDKYHAAQLKEQSMSGHFFNDGEKVELEVKMIKSFSFEGTYGRSWVRVYETRDGKIVKYVGSNPMIKGYKKESFVADEFTDWIKIGATIKHSSYRGPETKLLRMKIIKVAI